MYDFLHSLDIGVLYHTGLHFNKIMFVFELLSLLSYLMTEPASDLSLSAPLLGRAQVLSPTRLSSSSSYSIPLPAP